MVLPDIKFNFRLGDRFKFGREILIFNTDLIARSLTFDFEKGQPKSQVMQLSALTESVLKILSEDRTTSVAGGTALTGFQQRMSKMTGQGNLGSLQHKIYGQKHLQSV